MARPSIRDARPADAAACLAIYAPIASDSVVSLEQGAPSLADMADRIERHGASHAWLVAEQDGRVAGYAYGSPFRPRWGYRHTVEVAAYVDPALAGHGIGKALYTALFDRLAARGTHALVAVISAGNPSSAAFHRAMGFTPAGQLPQVGHKLGQWVDVTFWHRLL